MSTCTHCSAQTENRGYDTTYRVAHAWLCPECLAAILTDVDAPLLDLICQAIRLGGLAAQARTARQRREKMAKLFERLVTARDRFERMCRPRPATGGEG